LAADDLLKELDLETRFWALTHQLLAQWGTDPDADPPEPDWRGIPQEHRQALFRSAAALCRRFFDSELGLRCRQATRVDREFPFLYRHGDEEGPLYISGQIDLVFEWRDRLYLLDFKTDSSYHPGEHDCQLALYRLALAEQTEGEIRTFLFLLRSGEAVPCDGGFDPTPWIPRIRDLL
jgi:ATP-dependent exoDNAse (exonuclease V) beta subunit